jgi:hypothetical protein
MALGGFDLVWSVTQNTINSQLQWLQDEGLIASALAFGDLDGDGFFIGGSGADAALLGPPTVSFDTGQSNIARLILKFTGGTFTAYPSASRSAIATKYPLAGSRIAFKVNVAIGQLAHEDLMNGKAVPPEVAKILTAFDPTMFEVRSIFMDFQNSDLTTYDTVYSDIKFPNDYVKSSFGTGMGAWIGSHKGADNPFILGHSVERNEPATPGSPSILEPTGANFSTHVFGPVKQPGDVGLNTFNFLLVTGGRNITDNPKLYGPGAGVFDYNLVNDNAVDGAGYIDAEVFLTSYIKPIIIDPLNAALSRMPDYTQARSDRHAHAEVNDKSAPDAHGRATFVRDGLGWTYHDNVDLRWHESGFYSHDRWSRQHLSLAVQLKMAPDADKVSRLTLEIDGTLYRYEKDQLNTDVPPFKSNCYLGDGWAEATLPWSIKLQFVAGADGKLTVTKTAVQDPPRTDHGQGGAYDIADFFNNLFDLNTISSDWQNNAVGLSAVEKLVAQAVDQQTGNVLQAAATKIVMPAPKTFFYKNIRLDPQSSNIAIDLTYKAA